jgi:hydrogenase maturation protein HypF
LNSPSARSMGSLFDALGSLVLGKHNAGFEAELAIKLEQLASRYRLQSTSYKFKVVKSREVYIIDPVSMFKQIVSDIKKNSPKQKIAYRFHLTVAKMIVSVCAALARENNINKVVLSGGVFQNKLLLRLALDLLYKQHLVVYVHKELSCADSSISLGQAAIAGFRG